jgi:hypothetical protein
MFISSQAENSPFKITKFIAIDKSTKIICCNYYLDEVNLVVKTPLYCGPDFRENCTIEKFTLENYIYLLSYE